MEKWVVEDRYGNSIYMTQERWEHILESRPELEPYLEQFLETIRVGKRKQDALYPNKYRYFKQFDLLPFGDSHVIVIVICKVIADDDGNDMANNFVVTGWTQLIRPKN